MEDQDDRPIVPINIPIPWHHVKLVHAVPDSAGKFKDVIVDRVEVRKPSKVRAKFKTRAGEDFDERGKRIIPGLEHEIPWPMTETPEPEDCACDTLRIQVDLVTHRPDLPLPPMPISVVDELRNKYGRYRMRHDPEYIRKQELLEARKEGRSAMSRLVSTPMMELRARNTAERAEAAQRELSDEQLASIGEVMARGGERAAVAASAAMGTTGNTGMTELMATSAQEAPRRQQRVEP